MQKYKFIEVKSEIGAGTRGASLGVDAIKIAALDYGSNLFKVTPSVEVKNENYLLFEPHGSPYAKRIDGIYIMYERVSTEVERTLKEKLFPIILAGDNSTAGGSIAGVKMAFPDKRIGVIWIDAHADLHSPYTTPSGNLHGMSLCTALGEDNFQDLVNKPDKKTAETWNKLKHLGDISPKIAYRDLVFIGLRDLEPEENFLIKKHKVKVFTRNEVKRDGVESVAKETLVYLRDCDLIYISFDVDCIDPSISKGTGTPARNGISEKEAGSLMVRLVQNQKVCAVEISEVNPTLDKENSMAEIAFGVLQKVVSQLSH